MDLNWWNLGLKYKETPALGWWLLTFFIFIYLILRTIKKPLSLYLETRSRDIQKQIEEGRMAKLEAEQKLKQSENKLAFLEKEIEEMKNRFLEEIKAEKKELEKETVLQQEKILKDTKDTINALLDRSKQSLSSLLIEEAMLLAQNKISSLKIEDLDLKLKKELVHDVQEKFKVRKL